MKNTTFATKEFKALTEIPAVDLAGNFQAALAGGAKFFPLFREVISLDRGRGKLSANEYFYYRLWEKNYSAEDKKRFVGKVMQTSLHAACNSVASYMLAADKLVFHTLMRGAGLPVPELLAVAHPSRKLPGTPSLSTVDQIVDFFRNPKNYPFFIKPIDGKYSLFVVSADAFDEGKGELVLSDGRRNAHELAQELLNHAIGYLIQRRLSCHPLLAERFGSPLWSIRLLVLATPSKGAVIHRAVAKIATGKNPADNYWRPGNMLGAIRLDDGVVTRVVKGCALDLRVDSPHPDTGQIITGTAIPDWQALKDLCLTAAALMPGIRTQSWDIALTDKGPVLLEVNFGGDLNLVQLSHASGVLDDVYEDHLRRCGYAFKK